MLRTVTITGADNGTNPEDLLPLSKEFPFVEWGILASRSQEGNTRFPNREWINRFCDLAIRHNLSVSMHLCGGWVRELLTGELDWSAVPQTLLTTARRIQINTHAEPHVSQFGMVEKLREQEDKTFIFQWDNVNDHLAYAAQGCYIKADVLYDGSHGAGVLPEVWPRATNAFYCGYAGGLGPENVVEQNKRIAVAADGLSYWIDMEGRVRTKDGSQLDLGKVRSVLELMKVEILRIRMEREGIAVEDIAETMPPRQGH